MQGNHYSHHLWSLIIKWSTTSQMRYEAFGLSPVDYGVMNPTGEKFAFKSMSVFISIMMLVQRLWSRFINEVATQKRFGLWTWEWITAEEAERRANDGDPILELVPHDSYVQNHFGLALFISYLISQVCPYKIQPEKQGKLIWITGPPGLGMKLFFFILTFTF